MTKRVLPTSTVERLTHTNGTGSQQNYGVFGVEVTGIERGEGSRRVEVVWRKGVAGRVRVIGGASGLVGVVVCGGLGEKRGGEFGLWSMMRENNGVCLEG